MTNRSNATQPIRRQADGSIDLEFYMRRGRALRSRAFRRASERSRLALVRRIRGLRAILVAWARRAPRTAALERPLHARTG